MTGCPDCPPGRAGYGTLVMPTHQLVAVCHLHKTAWPVGSSVEWHDAVDIDRYEQIKQYRLVA